MIAYMFPGQGTQQPGMIRKLDREFSEIEYLFIEASEISGKDLVDLCKNANSETLKRTENTQLVVFIMNMAFYQILENKGVYPDVVLGHSLGQYSALCASGALSFKETVELVNIRATLMSKIREDGKLFSIVGVPVDLIQMVCDEITDDNGIVSIALYNTLNQIVIGGNSEYALSAANKLKQMGAVKVVELSVGNAFHTKLMDGMLEQFSDAVIKVHIKKPKCKIIMNCTGDYTEEIEAIKNEIIFQCSKPVLWSQGVQKLLHNKNLLLAEVGVGKTLSGMIRNIDKTKKVYPIENIKLRNEFLRMALEQES